MGRRNKNILWKENKKVNRFLSRFNKSLSEDVFSNRFKYEKIAVQTRNLDNGRGFTRWRFNSYLIRLVDFEQPERNVEFWCKWSDNFGLIDLCPAVAHNGSEYISQYGLPSIAFAMNNFIVKSDFWQLWQDEEYQKTHWYSGEALKNYHSLEH